MIAVVGADIPLAVSALDWSGTADRLDQIAAPTLVVHGDSDPLVPYPNGKYLAEHIQGARLVTLPGVGHISMIEEPGQFNREVIAFLG